MARQVLPIVGAAIGAWFGGPQGAQIGYAIGSAVGNAVDPLVINAPGIGDSKVQTSSEGAFRSIYFGTASGAGNVIMAGPDVKRIVEHDPGKGGGPVTEEERIDKTFAIGIGEGWNGEIVGVTRIWENEKLVYDSRPESTMLAESAKYEAGFTLYTGTETQLPDPDLEAIPASFGGGIGNVSAFRGLAYIVFPRKDITPWMSIPNYRFEIVTDGGSVAAKNVLAIRTREVSGNTFGDYLGSVDGWDWSGDWVNYTSALEQDPTRLIGTTLTQIAYESTGPAKFRYGFQDDWLNSAGSTMGGSGGIRLGTFYTSIADGPVVLIPGGELGIRRSADYGQTYVTTPVGPKSSAIEAHLGIFYSIFQTLNTADRSFDAGFTWAPFTPSGFSPSSPLRCKCQSTYGAIFAGSDGAGGAKIAVYPGPSPISTPTFPGGGDIRGICEGVIDGQPVIVCVSENLRIGRWTLGLWDYNDPGISGGGSIVPLWWTGTYFNMAVNDGANTKIYASTDAVNWSLRRTDTSLSTILIRDLVTNYGDVTDVTGEPIPLDEIVAKIHSLCAQPSSEYDVSGLSGKLVDGFILSGEYTGQSAIGTLAALYQFDSSEWDKKIRHRFRGRPSVRTINADDLVDEPEESTREDQIEYPKKLHLDAQNSISGYAPSKQTSQRESQDVRVVGEVSVSVPVVLSSDEQAQYAHILHKVAWEDARGDRKLVVTDRLLEDVPGDCYNVSIRGNSDRMRIAEQRYIDGVIYLTLRYDRISAYTSNATGLSPSPQTPPPSTIPGPTQIKVLDISALRDVDDSVVAKRYVALGPVSDSWYGAEAQESLNGGASYQRILRTSDASVMGELLTEVADASEHFTDTTNIVNIQLDLASLADRIESLTVSEFLSEGGGFALVNEDGTVEICQYKNVQDIGNGEIELTTLLRGRLNSGTYSHPVGTKFILLDSVKVVDTPSSYIGNTIYHRAISYGNTSETATTDIIVFEAKSQTEWPVANLILSRSSNLITATVVPRHRFGTDDNPIRSINWIGYAWSATDGSNTLSLDTISESTVFDVSGWSSPITVTVSQLNRITGAGSPVSEEIV